MKKTRIAIAFVSLFAVSCASRAVMGEMPQITEVNTAAVAANEQRIDRESEKMGTLELQYHIFRINQASYTATPYTITDNTLFTAFSNEFYTGLMNPAPSLTNAANLYLSLTNRYTNDLGFIFTRAAACLIQISDYRSAGMLLNRSLMSGYDSDETFYYKAQISAYYETNYATALFYAKQIKPKYLYTNPQDFAYFLADLYLLGGDNRRAIAAYNDAIAIAPGRFYILFDLTPVYISMEEWGLADSYSADSFRYLVSLDKPEFRIKAYRQRIELNRAMRQPTWNYRFDLAAGFDLYPNLFYFLPNQIYIKRLLSSAIVLPVKEKKETRNDENYYPTYESVVDFNDGTGYFLTAGRMTYTNDLLVRVLGTYCPTSRLYYQTNVAILMTPTNTYRAITNRNLPTNSPYRVQTVESNGIDVERLDFRYWITTDRFDADSDRQWDFVILGYNKTNDVVVSVYYPSKYSAEYFHFTMTRHDAEVVIQDFDRDGKNEIIALDNDVYILRDER